MRYQRLAALAVILSLAGCSEKGFYQGLQTGHQMNCFKARDRDACLEGTDMSYEEYQSIRRQSPEQTAAQQ